MSFLIILSLLIGFGLRLIAINQSLWLDEAISVQVATKFSFLEIINQFAPKDFNPPLYYLILHFWLKIFPATEFFIRLPSIIFGVLTALFIYKIYYFIFKEKKEALFSLVLLLTSALHIYYSQEARAYSLAAFTVTASMYYFIKLLKKKDTSNIAFYMFYTVLMLYSHYLCWLAIFTQVIYLFFYQKNKLKNYFWLFISLFLIYIPWLPTLFNQLNIGKKAALTNTVWRKIVGGLSLKSISLLPVKFIIGRTSFTNKSFYFILASILVLFFTFLLWQTKRKKQNPLAKLIWFWLVIPLILGIFISFKIPIFSYFRFLFCLPALYLLIARGVFSFKKPQQFIVLVLLINLFFSFRYLLNQNYYREDWKSALKVLHQRNINQTPVLILENVTAPFDYYDKGKSRLVFFNQREIVANEEVVWLIPYAQPIFDPRDLTRAFLKTKGFQRVYEEHFNGVTLEKWQKLIASQL